MSPRICGFAKYGLKKKIYAPTFPSRTHLGYDSISSMIRNIISFRESVKKTIGVVSFFDVWKVTELSSLLGFTSRGGGRGGSLCTLALRPPTSVHTTQYLVYDVIIYCIVPLYWEHISYCISTMQHTPWLLSKKLQKIAQYCDDATQKPGEKNGRLLLRRERMSLSLYDDDQARLINGEERDERPCWRKPKFICPLLVTIGQWFIMIRRLLLHIACFCSFSNLHQICIFLFQLFVEFIIICPSLF